MTQTEALKMALEEMKAGSYECAIDRLEEVLAQPEQAPVAHFGSAYVNENGVHITTVLGPVAIPQDAKLYTTPPQRNPLTDEQIAKIASTPCAVVGSYVHTFARAIEAAHGIKE